MPQFRGVNLLFDFLKILRQLFQTFDDGGRIPEPIAMGRHREKKLRQIKASGFQVVHKNRYAVYERRVLLLAQRSSKVVISVNVADVVIHKLSVG